MDGIRIEAHVRAGAIFFLEVRPVARHLPDEGRTERDAPFLYVAAAFRGDDNSAVAGCRAIKRRSCGTFQHRHRLDVVWIDIRGSVTEIDRRVGIAVGSAASCSYRSRLDGHAVDDEERTVVAMVEGVVTTERDTHGAKRTCAGLRHLQACHLAVHLLEPVAGNSFRKFLIVELRNGITQ